MENKNIHSTDLEGGADFFSFGSGVRSDVTAAPASTKADPAAEPAAVANPAHTTHVGDGHRDHPLADHASGLPGSHSLDEPGAGSDAAAPPDGGGAPDTSDFEVGFKGNPLGVIAKHWHAKGVLELPEGYDVGSMTWEDLDNALLASREAVLTEEVRKKLAEEQGLTTDGLKWYKEAWLGIKPQEVQEMNQFRALAAFAPDDDDPEYDERVRNYLTAYHLMKGATNAQAEKYVSVDMSSTDALDEAMSLASGFFGSKADDIENTIKERAAQKERDAADRRTKNLQRIEELLDRGEILGKRFSKEQITKIRAGMFDKTEMLVLPDGTKRKVSLLELKKYQARNDVEADLLHSAYMLLGTAVDEIQDHAQRATNKSMLDELAGMAIIKPKGQGGKHNRNGVIVSDKGIVQEDLS